MLTKQLQELRTQDKGQSMNNRRVSLGILGVLILALLALNPAFTLAQEDDQLTHVVQSGENLYRISLRYGLTMDEIAAANGITDYARIFRGQVLIIPGLSVPGEADTVVNPLVAGTPTTHVVQPGESLTAIAQQYDITVDQLLQSNNIANPNRIERGQELTVWTVESVNEATTPDVETVPEATTNLVPDVATVHVVQPGELLSSIAQRYGLSWTTLAQYNNIANADNIYAGQTLTIPPTTVDGSVEDLGIITTQPQNLNIPTPTITQGRQIIVDLSDSRTYAFEDGVLVNNVVVSTGLPATPTVVGDFTIYHRLPSQTMSGPGYNLPGVESVQYFYQGYAIHGTYWHNNFGQPMSHGCVNMTNEDAAWFYNFGDYGTAVRVQY